MMVNSMCIQLFEGFRSWFKVTKSPYQCKNTWLAKEKSKWLDAKAKNIVILRKKNVNKPY